MKHQQTKGNNNNNNSNNSSGKNGFTRNSFKFISSCIKTVSSGVRSASASVANSISADSNHLKDQVLWACFDKLELGRSSFHRVLLLGYINGFQVLDVDDASTVNELVSKRDGPCTFLQIQPYPTHRENCEGFRASHPLLLVAAGEVAAGDERQIQDSYQRRRDGLADSQAGNVVSSPTAVRFYSLKSHNYVHVLRFRSAVYTVRCSPHVVAVGLVSQIHCFDPLTLESKFSVLTYPVPQKIGEGFVGINVGYGPMDVGPRWLAYHSNNPLSTNTGRLSPQNLTPSPGVSPSTSPSSGSLVARYAMESSKQLATGLINLGDMGYKTLSKYYQEILPDGPSSPVTTSSGWKVNKALVNSPDIEIAGTVIVKDFVSTAVIAHFRAHTSPISALCFDPSGTLLVTASIHGNNINIFRIMPSSSQNGAGSQSYNSTSSHVHLYKLHRGITSAVIQDICFSQYSQWVAVISSKGTCHIYVLSPFGGECGLQVQNSYVDGPTLVPILSLPWWSTSAYVTNQQSFSAPPPPPVTLSVVSRIRTGNSGWLNTVSNVASSAAGMASLSSSAISAVFHCSMPNVLPPGRSNALEHLLVYSPSGHLIQYELFPSAGPETSDTGSRLSSGSFVQIQDEDLRVKSEPIQCWDVCRGADWPEREECVEGIVFGRKDHSDVAMETSDSDDNGNSEKGDVHEQSTLYLSKAEVQLSYGRMPSWQNSKIHFFAMNPVALDTEKTFSDDFGGEMDIEKVPHFEIEIKRKDLLPVFEHFQQVKPDWRNRDAIAQKYPSFTSEGHLAGEKYPPGSAIYPQPVPKSLLGPSTPTAQMDTTMSYLTLAQNSTAENGMKISSYPSSLLTQNSFKADNAVMEISPPENSCVVNSPPLIDTSVITERATANNVGTSEASNLSSNRSDFSMNVVDEGSVQDPLDFGGLFEEEYCKAASLDENHEVVTDVDSSSSPREKDKSEEDGDNDDMLGGVFDFSEEG
ncbi:autophagy-related protein 18h-like [Silene latifolia]|uniref:autophagy-related protein 18h-like n=1 Tax=Silene latifolia TaxID=37657 RepID=UPI003D78A499